VNFELVCGCHAFARVQQAVGKQEKQALLETLSRELVQAAFPDEGL